MASRACFRSPTVKDAAQIPDGVITIHDLKRHIRSFYNIPSSTVFHLRTWTNPNHGSKKRTTNLKDDQYIVDPEDAHNGSSPLVIVPRWTELAEQRNLCRVRQKLELKDRQGRTHKQAEIDKHVCGICRRAECDETLCNPYDVMQKERPRLSVKLEVTICDFRIYVWGLSVRIVLGVIFVKREDKLRI